MPQQILDPNPSKIVPSGNWKPSGPIPVHVRRFKYFPNINDWLPGDLLLVSAVRPGWISRSIIAAQVRGGYRDEDACWHHAAMYIGDANVCEAVGSGVQLTSIFHYVGSHRVRVRRDLGMTAEDRFRLVVKALARLRNSYSRGGVIKLFLRSFKGFWKDSAAPVTPFGVRAVICSQLYADAYAMVTSKLVVNTSTTEVTPAALSETQQLTDIRLYWKSIG
jgi:hypothetical protein